VLLCANQRLGVYNGSVDIEGGIFEAQTGLPLPNANCKLFIPHQTPYLHIAFVALYGPNSFRIP
jgi:hypothetical protein